MNLPSIPRSFFSGDCFDAYHVLGAHPWQGDRGEEGWRFAVWAPGATAVEVCLSLIHISEPTRRS